MDVSQSTTFRFYVVAALAVSCTAYCGCSDAEKNTHQLPWPDPYTISDDLGPKARKIAETFVHYDNLAAAVQQCSEVELYEGLPHYTWEVELLEQELKNKDTVEFGGGSFYAKPLSLSPEDAKELKRRFCRRQSFMPFHGFKPCGGYHPDWRVIWKNGEKEFQVEFCFGCGEMTATNGTVELYCEMQDMEIFRELLEPYQKQRPKNAPAN